MVYHGLSRGYFPFYLTLTPLLTYRWYLTLLHEISVQVHCRHCCLQPLRLILLHLPPILKYPFWNNIFLLNIRARKSEWQKGVFKGSVSTAPPIIIYVIFSSFANDSSVIIKILPQISPSLPTGLLNPIFIIIFGCNIVIGASTVEENIFVEVRSLRMVSTEVLRL